MLRVLACDALIALLERCSAHFCAMTSLLYAACTNAKEQVLCSIILSSSRSHGFHCS
jgi:hypothetical protein